ncbi:MAG: glycosyltransferase family 9 protein [Chitinophagaceae bacterium]|jgi:ADP-heptose:LPS heptosyltransferase|nr:glycosyltransferase family 9 protein [Chitinophagaceae bacterium]
MKFLVIRFSSIGDIVLATPAIRCLKQQIPDAELHFLTKKSFKAVTEANPYIDRFHYFDNNLPEIIKTIKQEKFDCVIDLHKNLRTLRIRLSLWGSVKWLSYKKLTLQKFLLTKFHINIISKEHISQRCIHALKPLGIADDGKGLDYFIKTKNIVVPDLLPETHKNGYAAIAIGGSYFTKKMPVEKLISLCKMLEQKIILLGGSEDEEAGNAIAATNPEKIYNACGKYNLNQSADIVRRAAYVVSHDTGLQYIACAFQKPVLAIWGGTSPMLAVEPYYGTNEKPKHTNFIVPELGCQPCSNYGTRTCPKKHFKCMYMQNIEAIAGQANVKLEN